MRARVCDFAARTCSFATAVALVNRWFMMAAGFALVAVLPLYVGGGGGS